MVSRHAEFLKLDLICGRASIMGDTEWNYIHYGVYVEV